jgi:hypothetical protein
VYLNHRFLRFLAAANMGLKFVVLPHWKRAVVNLPPHRDTRRFDDVLPKANMGDRRSEINWVIMDYLVSEGYPGAAEKFAQETNLPTPVDHESIRERVRVRNAIHAGRVDEAIEMINEIDPDVSVSSLSLQTLEMIIYKFHAPLRAPLRRSC